LKEIIRFLFPLFIIVLSACSSASRPDQVKPVEMQTVKIGAFIGLTGDVAGYGDAQKRGIDLAVREINEQKYLGNKLILNVLIVDAGASGDTAVAAINNLINDEKVVGLIGPTLSSQAFAADPVAQKAQIPVIAASNTVPGITEMGDYIFRCSLPETSVIGGTIKAAASRLGVKKVAMLWGKDDDYTVAGYQVFADIARKNGLAVVADETFARGGTDFKPQLTRIIDAGPDAILVSALAKEAAGIIVQARALGYDGIIIGGNGFNSPSIIADAGNYAEGVMSGTAWNIASMNPRNLQFIAAFQKTYSIKPDQFAAQAYTATWLFANALRTAGNANPRMIRDALAKTSNFTTPLGAFSFTPGREPVHPSIVQIVKNGKFTIFNP
jgi:branched-chain amino acid transport system substrate-binding protein